MNMMTKDQPAALLPRAELLALFERPTIGRDDVERAVDALIAHLDALDGDPDLEDSYDRENDATDAEGFTWPEAGEDGYGVLGGGLAVDADDAEADGYELRAGHIRRIQHERCSFEPYSPRRPELGGRHRLREFPTLARGLGL